MRKFEKFENFIVGGIGDLGRKAKKGRERGGHLKDEMVLAADHVWVSVLCMYLYVHIYMRMCCLCETIQVQGHNNLF